ncbi:MAG: hypothetical protein KDC38_11610, partial [Planctomycetes bacterium]|nr:hypothetical protein [Planctomycetota bacterium]
MLRPLLGTLFFVGVLFSGAPGLAQLTPTWTGAGVGDGWSNPENWDLALVPCDAPPTLFAVTLPDGAMVDYDLACDGVTGFTLGDDARIRVLPGTNLTVFDAAQIAGIVEADGGSFVATSTPGGAGFSGNRARGQALAGGTLVIGAVAYSSVDLFGNSCGTHQLSLFTADGPGSSIDLSTILTFDAGFIGNANPCVIDRQQVFANNGGSIDLSGVTMLTAPTRHEDAIEFRADDGSSIALTALASITSASSGRTRFEVVGSGTIELASLTELLAPGDLGEHRFIATDGATLALPSLEIGEDLVLIAESGGVI